MTPRAKPQARGRATWVAALVAAAALGCASSSAGSAASNGSCETDEQCRGGACLPAGPSGAGVCSPYCASDADCPNGWSCGTFGGISERVCRCDGAPGSCDGETTESCPQSVATPWTGATCSEATRECMRSCATGVCARECVYADPSPEACQGCVDRSLLVAANEHGCQQRYNCLAACYAGDCPSGSCDRGCVAEEEAWLECAETLSDTARAEAIAGCFP